MHSKKHHNKELIFFSAGYDSTLVLLNAFKENRKFDIFCVDLNGTNYGQMVRQRRAANKIIKLLSDRYKVDYEPKIITAHKVSVATTYFAYQLTIVNSIASTEDINFNEYDVLTFGYIKNDVYWHIRTEIESIIQNIWKIATADRNVSPVCFYPIEYLDKEQVMSQLLEEPRLVNLPTTCEEYIECNDSLCEKCKSAKDALDSANNRSS